MNRRQDQPRSSAPRWDVLGLGALVLVALIVAVGLVLTHDHSARPSHARPAALAARPLTGHRVQPRSANPLASLGLRPVRGARGGPSGVPIPHGNPSGWKQVFSDDFPTDEDTSAHAFASCAWGVDARASECPALPPAARAKWFAYPDGLHPRTGTGIYEPADVVSISAHQLIYSLDPQAGTGIPRLAAMEAKLPVSTGSMRYGAVAVRFKAEPVRGYELSFELWPADNRGAQAGNIQFPAGELSGTISAKTVRPGVPGSEFQSTRQPYRGWHTAVTEWTPDQVRFFLDGRSLRVETGRIPSSLMNWVLQVVGEPTTAHPSAGTGRVSVAWVSAYVPAARARQ